MTSASLSRGGLFLTFAGDSPVDDSVPPFSAQPCTERRRRGTRGVRDLSEVVSHESTEDEADSWRGPPQPPGEPVEIAVIPGGLQASDLARVEGKAGAPKGAPSPSWVSCCGNNTTGKNPKPLNPFL